MDRRDHDAGSSHPSPAILQFRRERQAPSVSSRHLATSLRSTLRRELPSLIEVGDIQHQRHLLIRSRGHEHGEAPDDLGDLAADSRHIPQNSLVHQTRQRPSLIRAAVDRYRYRVVLDRAALSYRYLLIS